MNKKLLPYLMWLAVASICFYPASGNIAADSKAEKLPPNILFFVMDDVGIDQFSVFGYGGNNPPQTPNIDAVAKAGVRFRNAWSQPSCSPSRAAFFNGRYSVRTNIYTAITGADLANSAESPYSHTTPKLLKKKGYKNAFFGKIHLSGSQVNPDNNPYGNKIIAKLGWEHFEGYLDGGPYPIDTTAGGIGGAAGNGKTYGCGFVPSVSDDATNGADTGACYTDKGATCEVLSTSTLSTPGRTCLEKGGIFDPNQTCQSPAPAKLNFDTQNGYYTAEWVFNSEDKSTTTLEPADAAGRGYRTTQEADRAISWVKAQSRKKPWMTTVSFSAIHEPVQPPPAALAPVGSPNTSGYDCESEEENFELATQMLEAIDKEIGRVLVETGVASYNDDGSLNYRPGRSNTVVVITGDNGTWTTSVREPFDSTRAKGTPYQTGVWVPQIVAGPMVKKPGRIVDHMTNNTDLFTLFAEVAGVDLDDVIPKNYKLDSEEMMPYLQNPSQGAIRTSNFTIQANNLRPTNAAQFPCLIRGINTCSMILPGKSVCEFEAGEWFGPGGTLAPQYLNNCCELNEYLAEQNQPTVINSISQRAIRNRKYKLVRNELENCSGGTNTVINEFYEINTEQNPKLDREELNLLRDGAPALSKKQRNNYSALRNELKELENSVVDCPGDGNLDGKVDNEDLQKWQKFAATSGQTTPNGGGKSSWYDLNLDGLTNNADKKIIQKNLGKVCK